MICWVLSGTLTCSGFAANTNSAQVKGTRRRDLTISARKNAVSATRDASSSAHRVTSGIARSAHENGDVISTQRATISDDMDMISIDKLMVSAAELSLSDDMDMISIDKPTISAAEPNLSVDELMISAAELSLSDDIGMISPNEPKRSTAQGKISLPTTKKFGAAYHDS